MSDTYTPNINLDLPSNGSYQNDWNVPVNNNFSIIDSALGSQIGISVTGVASGSYALTAAQYQCFNLTFTGVLTGNLVFYVPANVSRFFGVANYTTGNFTLGFGGGTLTSALGLIQGYRSFILTDGAGVNYVDTAQAATAQAAAESFATTAANNAQSAAISTSETYAAAQANAAYGNAIVTANGYATTAQSNAEAYAASQASAAQSAAISASENYANGTHNFPAGWAKFPSGLIMLTGVCSGTPTAVPNTFPNGGFPNGIMSITCTSIGLTGGGLCWVTSYIYGSGSSVTGFNFYDGGSGSASYTAFGY